VKHIQVLALAAAFLLGACSGKGGGGGSAPSPSPNVAACRAAMEADYRRALETPSAPSATRPPACAGVDDATLQQIVGEIIASVTATP